jgi:hypothetical protein
MAHIMEFAQESVQGDSVGDLSRRRRRPGLLAIAVVLVVVALTTTVAIVVYRNSPLDFYVYYIAGPSPRTGTAPMSLPARRGTIQPAFSVSLTTPLPIAIRRTQPRRCACWCLWVRFEPWSSGR